MNRLLSIFLFSLILFSACKEDDPIDPVIPDPETLYDLSKSVFVVSEGAFQSGNASLEIYNNESKEVNLSAFSEVNERPLGDVFQSMTFHEDIAYAVVNNSGNIERFNLDDFTALDPISGLTSPRYAVVHENLIWVTDLFSGQVNAIDINTLETIHQIPVNGWTEEIVVLNDKIYVGAVNAGLIYEITPTSTPTLDSIVVQGLPVHLKTDGENLIVGAACCDWYWSDPGFVHYVDPSTKSVEWTYSFTEGWPSGLELNESNDEIYWIEGGVKSLDLEFHTTPTVIINEPTLYSYALGVDPRNGDIYLSDPIDFSSASSVTRYSSNGDLLDSFSSGVATGGFYFTEE